MKNLITIKRTPHVHWVGNGFPVRTVFSTHDLAKHISPFLMLDYAGPAEFAPSNEQRGVGEHPHRGFETVTIVYQGELEHRDSAGNHGRIGAGDVQWMTAASGVVHEEWHEQAFTRRGGVLEMVQLWVNLPKKDKMSAPRYQEILSAKIPTVNLNGAGTLRVIAGEFQGAKGAARTFTPLSLWDVRLNAGKRVEFKIPNGHTALALVLHGSATFNDSQSAAATDVAVFERSGDQITVEANEDSTILVLSGEPINEPVASYGPFVMNTESEIRQAIVDYQAGRMGHLANAS